MRQIYSPIYWIPQGLQRKWHETYETPKKKKHQNKQKNPQILSVTPSYFNSFKGND